MANELDEPDPGFSKRLWAAYVLGRYPHALLAWIDRFFFLDSREDLLRTSVPDAFNVLLGEFPYLYLDLDEAILELALAHELDPYWLVEIRNSIYRSEAASRELLIAADELVAGQTISEFVWQCRRPVDGLADLSQATELQSGELGSWKQLGDLIGSGMRILMTPEFALIRPWQAMDEFLARLVEGSIRERLQPVVDYWHEQQQLSEEAGVTVGQGISLVNALLDRVADLDASFLRTQRRAVVGGPLLVVDRAQEQLVFLGHPFEFSEFKQHANGGLKCFLYLAEQPQTWVTRDDIIEGAELSIDLEQLPIYFSHFRRVVTPATKPYGQRIAGQRRLEAEAAFIISKRKKRHQVANVGSYKLAIDADRIELR